jgi:hypothetical protein|tara:strand:+ start:2858 stop:3256 length:399 start_codon:yes stop_codon:yes gene_type:complete
MATNAQWTVVFEDKMIIKNYAEGASEGVGYVIDDNDFWGLAKWANIWAIQYATSNVNDQVEYRDATPHSSWDNANLGDFQDFITRWDTAHLARLQSDWDNDNTGTGEGDNYVPETEADKIARLGARPTSYSS